MTSFGDGIGAIIGAVSAILIIFMGGFIILPALGQATGQSVAIFQIGFILLAIGVIASVIVAFLR
jgi:hypothetical protein